MALWKYTLAGVDLDDFQAQILDVNGLEGRPPRRGRNVTVPYRHGSYSSRRKWYEPRLGVLVVRVFDTNASGVIDDGDGKWAHAEDNRDRFLELLHAYSDITLQKTMADGSSLRSLDVEFLSDVVVSQLDPSRGVFDIRAPFEASDPFWYSPAATATYTSVSSGTAPSITINGNAPTWDPVFTVTASSAVGLSIQVDDDGTLTFPGTASGTVVIDVGNRTVENAAGSGLAETVDVDRTYWVEFAPDKANEVDIQISSGSIDLEVVYKDRWF